MYYFKDLGILKLLSRFGRLESRRQLNGLCRRMKAWQLHLGRPSSVSLLSCWAWGQQSPGHGKMVPLLSPSQACSMISKPGGLYGRKQSNPPGQGRLQATEVSPSALGRGCGPNHPWAIDPFFFVLYCYTLCDSSRVCHMPPQPFWLGAERGHFLFSEILTVTVPLLCMAYTGSLRVHVPPRYVVPRCPMYPTRWAPLRAYQSWGEDYFTYLAGYASA